MHGHAEWINIINYCMGPDNYPTSCTNLLSQYVQYFKIHGFHNARNYKLNVIWLILPNLGYFLEPESIYNYRPIIIISNMYKINKI